MLYREFMDVCKPSNVMNKATFEKYMSAKGLKSDKVDNTFR